MALSKLKTITITIPDYKADEKPEIIRVGAKLDSLLAEHFSGKHVVLRCIGTRDHPGKTLDEIAKIVLHSGTDKYDPHRKGIGYEIGSNQGKHIDFYGTEVVVRPDTDIFTRDLLSDFYDGAIGDRGYHIRIDLVIVYDAAKLTKVEHLYGQDIEESDGYVFNELLHKTDALLGLIKITWGQLKQFTSFILV